jgi:hypothetical protein
MMLLSCNHKQTAYDSVVMSLCQLHLSFPGSRIANKYVDVQETVLRKEVSVPEMHVDSGRICIGIY